MLVSISRTLNSRTNVVEVASSDRRLARNSSTETIWTDLTRLAIETFDPNNATTETDPHHFTHYTIKELSESTHAHLYTLEDATSLETEIATDTKMAWKPKLLLEAQRRSKKRKREARAAGKTSNADRKKLRSLWN
jgi:hypothetical protein